MRPFVLLAIAVIGCGRESPSPTPDAAPAPEPRVDHRLPVLQSLKAEVIDVLRRANRGEVCYVSFGSGEAAGRTDPPAECLRLPQAMTPAVGPESAGELELGEA